MPGKVVNPAALAIWSTDPDLVEVAHVSQGDPPLERGCIDSVVDGKHPKFSSVSFTTTVGGT